MFRDFRLEPITPWARDPIEFSWDEETGEVRGPDAAIVQAMAADVMKLGYIGCKPIPSSIRATDPLRNRTEFAALLGYSWKLPPDLDSAYPVIEDDGPLDPPDLPILY